MTAPPPGFTVLRPLAEGSSGTLWLLRASGNDDDEGPGALCVWKPGASVGERAVARRCRNPRLLGMEDALAQAAASGTLTALVPGGTLEQLCAARPLSVAETLWVLRGVLSGLDALARLRCSHGDLHPANVLFTAEAEPVLCDYGRSQPQLTRRISAGDLTALGALGWFCLTGQEPPEDSQRLPLGSVLSGERVPGSLARVIEAALTGRASAAAWRLALHRCGRGHPPALGRGVDDGFTSRFRTAGREPSPGERRALRSADFGGRRRPRLAGAVLLAVSCLLGVLLPGLGSLVPGRGAIERETAPGASSSPSAEAAAEAREITAPQTSVSRSGPQRIPVKREERREERSQERAETAEEAVSRLVAERARHLASGESAAFLAVSQSGSQARQMDQVTAGRLGSQRMEGLTSRVEQLAGRQQLGEQTVRFRARIRTSAYRLGGKSEPERTEEVLVSVTRTPSGWRLSAYEPVRP